MIIARAPFTHFNNVHNPSVSRPKNKRLLSINQAKFSSQDSMLGASSQAQTYIVTDTDFVARLWWLDFKIRRVFNTVLWPVRTGLLAR